MEKKYREPWEYPIGNDDFADLITSGCVYVDKTDIIYQTVRLKYVFLSRPRRFGKSLLCSTLQAYFLGKKELFKGLAMERLETKWDVHPVFRFDMSSLKGKTPDQMRNTLLLQLQREARANKLEYKEVGTPGDVFQYLVEMAYYKENKGVVILIDEYDSPLLHTTDKEQLEQVRAVLQEFYITCKKSSQYLRHVFITGITRFSQVSIFSELNNLNNISMSSRYATILGITEDELHSVFDDDVEHLALSSGKSKEEMYDILKWKYNGFHFAGNSPGVYNPYSMLLVLAEQQLNSYWFGTATPSALFKLLKDFQPDIKKIDSTGYYVKSTSFDHAIHEIKTTTDICTLMYQLGFLTIKEYDRDTVIYILGIPNDEVRCGLTEIFKQR